MYRPTMILQVVYRIDYVLPVAVLFDIRITYTYTCSFFYCAVNIYVSLSLLVLVLVAEIGDNRLTVLCL